MRLQILKVHPLGSRRVGGFKIHAGGNASFQSFLPALNAEAPFVTGLQTREIVFGAGRAQIIPHALGKFEELFRDLGTDSVQTFIIGTCAAVTVAVKTSQGLSAAALEFLTEDVGRHERRGGGWDGAAKRCLVLSV
jgi:hypothetical protein